MVTVLIPTMVGDDHALAVSITLEAWGHRAIRLFTADYPGRSTSTLSFAETGSYACRIRTGFDTIADCDIDVVWHRRVTRPRIPEQNVHPEDMWLAQGQAHSLFESQWLTAYERARWVNPRNGWWRSSSKALQLREAVRAGLAIPRTLMSNDLGEVTDFVRENPQGVVFKLFSPAAWRDDDGISVAEARLIHLTDIPSASAIRLCPAIYQSRVEKASDVRIIIMGDHAVAFSLASSDINDGIIDHRHKPMDSERAHVFEADKRVIDGCKRLMRALDIVFGAFDFAMNREGELIFLEVNEAGQFLYIDRLCPESNLLAAFSEFLLDPTEQFRPKNKRPSSSYEALRSSPEFSEQLCQDGLDHVADYPAWRKAS
ncbi:MAG: hypothetical protein WC729_25655 [Sphingomonas sp.]|jgi:glutathione synthase/RimK-type ligase-like ATP-grasp enzyme|uniref:hypothetical protein n=1 Tax=Sphingomonas sp. TaxID=28214 RepID=UPI003562A227